MATADDIDPAQASRRVNDQLRVAISQLDEHIQALAQPTMELALAQRRRVAESGLEERAPSELMRKFISEAGPHATIGSSEPGQLNPDASNAAIKEGWERFFGGQTGRSGPPGLPPGMSPGAGSAIAGKTNVEAEKIASQGFVIPQFGDWQLDSLLRMAAHTSGQMAMRSYKSQAEEEFKETGKAVSPEEWQKAQRSFASTNMAQKFESGATRVAEASLIHKKILSPLLDLGFGASNAGASLGYSPQSEGLGGGVLGASHYFGIPNPIAALTSPGGRQGFGSVINAAEAAIGGTGIGLGEANSLRQTLGQQGWSNQRAGGLLGATIGGEQETLALALEPLMKKGFKNPEVLAEFTSALKLGSGNIGELTQGIEQLAETAKMTHQTLEAEAVKAQEFMAKTVEGGSTMMHGLTAYGEIGKATKMNPLLIQGINEGQFGQIQALSKGIMPWEVAGMSGNAAALNAWETVKKVSGYVPHQSNTEARNKITGKMEITETAAAKEAGYIHMLEPSITAEQAKRLKEIGPKLEAITGGLSEAHEFESARGQMEKSNIEKTNAYRQSSRTYQTLQHEKTYAEQLEREIQKHPKEGFFGEGNLGDLEEKLRHTKENIHGRSGEIDSDINKAKKIGNQMNSGQQRVLLNELEGPKGMYSVAKAAGVSDQELNQIKKERIGSQGSDIAKALEKLNKVSVEKEKEENAKIELSPETAKWFKLKFPNAKSSKEEANAGGKSTASQAAQPNAAGETAAEQSMMRQFEQIQRHEPTTAH